MDYMNVSAAARLLGRSERWLREAEKQGKIPKARRDLNNWRVYTRDDIETIKALLIPSDGRPAMLAQAKTAQNQ